MHLLQLAGGQSWPNLLPILALKPTTVTFLTSSDPRREYRDSIHAIEEACHRAGVTVNLQAVSTQAKDPTTDECREILKNLSPDVINLTGGTKPMSIAAYNLAQALEIPAFYLDTRRKESPVEAVNCFSSDVKDRINEALPSIVAKLTVPIALKANGFPVPASFEVPAENWTKFAIKAARLRQDATADSEIAQAIRQLRTQLMGNDSEMPKKSRLRNVLQIPISGSIGSHWHQYLIAASDADIIELTESVESGHQDFFLIRDDPVKTAAEVLRSRAIENFKLLEGVWFELALLASLQKTSSFTDISWSVEADHLQDPTASSRGETDLVAFNADELSLHFISCKTTGPHGGALDHIQGLRNRATKEGGKFSRAELWIFRPKNLGHLKDLAEHCKAHDVSLHVFTDPLSK